jgi:hypothetical protein
MVKVSNQEICDGTSRNIGYYYGVVIPSAEANTFCFKTPVDFGKGGFTMWDGKIVNQYSKNVASKADKLDFCVNATAGNHIFEMYGSESCCDKTTKWQFQVNGGKWEDFSQANLNRYKVRAQIKGDSVVEFGTVSVDQKNRSLWYEVKIQGMFNSPVVVMGPLSFKGTQPTTVRVKDVTRQSFKFQIQEWIYLDGKHNLESVSYMIVEEGEHQLNDGTWIEAGKAVVGSEWVDVKFDADFTKKPVVFS